MADIDINEVQKNIEELQDQNAIDFQQWKKLGQDIEELAANIKTNDNRLRLVMEKIKSDYKNLKKVIIDENVQFELINSISEINEQLGDIAKYNNTVNLSKLGVVSQNVVYNTETKKYEMTDISNIVNNAIVSGCDVLIFPSGNFLIENPIIVDRPMKILGQNTNIYKSPTEDSTTLFSIRGSNISIDGINIFSKIEYNNNIAEENATGLTSNVCGINVLGEANSKNVEINNCYFENLAFGVSIQTTKNVNILKVKATGCYFAVYTGLNAENITIKDSDLACQDSNTDVYGHVLYFAHTTKNVFIDNCTLTSLDVNSSNIIKCGSNTGASNNVVVANTNINITTNATVFYTHNGADLTLYNCKIVANAPSGYARLLQSSNNTSFKCINCEISLDSFDKYTQAFNHNNCSIVFENSIINIKNTYNTYSNLPFVSGSDIFEFKNCTINIDIDRGFNIFNSDFRCLLLDSCKIFIKNSKITCGVNSPTSVSYSRTTSPILEMYNNVITNTTSTGYNSSAFFMHIVKDSTTTPVCKLTNNTFFKCSGTSGNNLGKLFMADAEEEYIKNNVVDLTP